MSHIGKTVIKFPVKFDAFHWNFERNELNEMRQLPSLDFRKMEGEEDREREERKIHMLYNNGLWIIMDIPERKCRNDGRWEYWAHTQYTHIESLMINDESNELRKLRFRSLPFRLNCTLKYRYFSNPLPFGTDTIFAHFRLNILSEIYRIYINSLSLRSKRRNVRNIKWKTGCQAHHHHYSLIIFVVFVSADCPRLRPYRA